MPGILAFLLQWSALVFQAHTHIFTPANGSVTRRENYLPHACMYTLMHVDIYTYIAGRARGET